MNSQDRCFIITPIGDDSDPIRRHIEGIIDAAIRPALCDIRVVESCIIVEDVHIDEQNKEIKIFTRLMSKISVPDVYHYFEKTLSEFGFVGLKVLPRNRPYALE